MWKGRKNVSVNRTRVRNGWWFIQAGIRRGTYNTTTLLQEHVCVETNDTGLIGLGDVGKDDIDHADEHPVLHGVTSVLNNRDDVGALCSEADQVASTAVRELHSVDNTGGADNVGNVRDGGTGSGAEVEHFAAGSHEDIVQTTEDTGSQLGSEGVPHTVLGLCGGRRVAVHGL